MAMIKAIIIAAFTFWAIPCLGDEATYFSAFDVADTKRCVEAAIAEAGRNDFPEVATALSACYRRVEQQCHDFYMRLGNTAIGHFESHICIDAEIKVWEELLKQRVQSIQHILETELHPVNPQTFAAAQTRWNDYVDEDCDVIRQAHGSGSGESYIVADCYGMHTAQRYIRLVTTPF